MGNKLPKPGPHIWDKQFEDEISFLEKCGFPDVHYYIGRGRFTLANDKYLFRFTGTFWHWNEIRPGQKLVDGFREEHIEIYKRKSRPFLPVQKMVYRKNYTQRAGR